MTIRKMLLVNLSVVPLVLLVLYYTTTGHHDTLATVLERSVITIVILAFALSRLLTYLASKQMRKTPK